MQLVGMRPTLVTIGFLNQRIILLIQGPHSVGTPSRYDAAIIILLKSELNSVTWLSHLSW
jgi:hypothetical protein